MAFSGLRGSPDINCRPTVLAWDRLSTATGRVIAHSVPVLDWLRGFLRSAVKRSRLLPK
jgi:hypothetical protein